MDKKATIYGTPLSKSTNVDVDETRGPIGNRRAKLNQQQVVKDDQGRRRFHGAFTGGFSAGYYNTVDSIEGFRPRQFVTHKDSKNDSNASKFSHRPEDYMDEEDFGEFGIAPKKIRINNQYYNNEDPLYEVGFDRSHPQITKLLQPATISIGEKILNKMSSDSGTAKRKRDIKTSVVGTVPNKSDFHGLGYKSLNAMGTECLIGMSCDSNLPSRSNRLKAVTEQGRLLEIAGEAFGSGVLDEDDDYVGSNDAYGYDSIQDYEFLSSKRRSARPQARFDRRSYDQSTIPGFVLASEISSMELYDRNDDRNFDLMVPDDWVMPVRKEPYIPSVKLPPSSTKLTLQDRQSTPFTKKFTGGSKLLNTDGLSMKSGLVSYSDLKTSLPPKFEVSTPEDLPKIDASISRQIYEWRPCSLLCKRFNVPNPFPDNSYCGVNPNELQKSDPTPAPANQDQAPELAPIFLRESIFNVLLDQDTDLEDCDNNERNETDSEDEPQVVEVTNVPDKFDDCNQVSCCDEDDDSDVEVVTAPRQEPELIELSSSSSVSSHSSKTNRINLTEPDLYGPPLPPEPSRALSQPANCDPDQYSKFRHKRSPSSKHKKHKKHKRRKSKKLIRA